MSADVDVYACAMSTAGMSATVEAYAVSQCIEKKYAKVVAEVRRPLASAINVSLLFCTFELVYGARNRVCVVWWLCSCDVCAVAACARCKRRCRSCVCCNPAARCLQGSMCCLLQAALTDSRLSARAGDGKGHDRGEL